jgi:hypothetical protein
VRSYEKRPVVGEVSVNWIAAHWYFLVGLLGVGGCALFVWHLVRHPPKEGSRSFMSFAFVWPVIIEAERVAKRKTRVGFVVVGAVVMLALVVLAIFLHPSSR